MKRKEIILGVIGIIVIVVVAFFVASIIHDYNNKTINKNESSKEKEEEKLEIDGKEVNFKTYRVDSSFFLNVPDIFVMLDEDTLKEKYNYNSRPELVFMSEDDLEHIFINTTDEDMTDDALETYLNGRIATVSSMTLLDSGVYKKYNKTFAKLVVHDDKTYYNFRFFTLDNKLVIVEFNSSVDLYKDFEDVVNEIMDSICFNEEDIKKYSSG